MARGSDGSYIIAFRMPNDPTNDVGVNKEVPNLSRETELGMRISEAMAGLARNEQINILPGVTPFDDVSDSANPVEFPPSIPDSFTLLREVTDLDLGQFFATKHER